MVLFKLTAIYFLFNAMMSICFANGLIGKDKYIFTRKFDLGILDFRENGKNFGITFLISKSLVFNKSHIVLSVNIDMCV